MAIKTTRIYLVWYRDFGKGQQAADATPAATQKLDGSFPVAEWDCKNEAQARLRWYFLYQKYQVNAMQYSIIVPV